MALPHAPTFTCALLATVIIAVCHCTAGTAAIKNKNTFSIGSIDCNLTCSGVPILPDVKVHCSAKQDIHVTPEEATIHSILQECRNWLIGKRNPKSFELYISGIHLTLSEPQSASAEAFLTKLQLQRCTIHGIKREFFAKYILKDTGSLYFYDCEFSQVACSDLSTAFSFGQFTELQLVKSTWCRNSDTVISNVNARQMIVSQDAAQPDATLVLDEITLFSNLSISVESGLQRVRLRRVRPAHLVLTGVELLDVHSPNFLRNAKAYSVLLRRCLVPPEASDYLLRNMDSVMDFSLMETDIDNLPLVSADQQLTRLALQNCRLERIDFSRLKNATMTLTLLVLSRASIKELPTSWSLVANGSILSRLSRVDLRGNQMRQVPHVPNGRPYQDAAHFVVQLGGNPLHCGCELAWLASNEDRIKAVYRNDDPSCATPERLAGMRVADAFRLHDPCAEGPAKPPGKTGAESPGVTPNLQPAESSASILAIVVAVLVALIVAIVLIVLCWKWRQRSGGRGERDKVKYTLSPWEDNPVMQMNGYSVLSPASKEDGRMTDSDKTTMLRSDESHGGKLANV